MPHHEAAQKETLEEVGHQMKLVRCWGALERGPTMRLPNKEHN